MQQETWQKATATREEAIALLAQARAEADAVRGDARAMLERARGEVAALARRRDDISSQLGHLSGVIEALAVPERPTGDAMKEDRDE